MMILSKTRWWREAIQRLLCWEKQSQLGGLWVKLGLFALRTCEGSDVSAYIPCFRDDSSDRSETTEPVQEWKQFSSEIWSKKKERPTVGDKTFLMFFNRSSTRQHDYRTWNTREKAQRQWHKMKTDQCFLASAHYRRPRSGFLFFSSLYLSVCVSFPVFIITFPRSFRALRPHLFDEDLSQHRLLFRGSHLNADAAKVHAWKWSCSLRL